MPLFSIVIPVLNQFQFIERALMSVLSQSFDDYEMIVVDGGSTDGTVDILNTHASQIAWMCSEKDRGQSDALNKGFAHAKGKYFFWLNADDILLPDALAALSRIIGQTNFSSVTTLSLSGALWIAGNMMIVDKDDRVIRCLRDGVWHDFMYHHAPVQVYGPSSVFSRALYDSVGGFDESLHYAMDTDLWLRFKSAGARYIRLNKYIWGFRYHAGSKTRGGCSETEEIQAAERKKIYLQNGLTVKWWNPLLNRLVRFLNGAYILAGYDTIRFRGRKV